MTSGPRTNSTISVNPRRTCREAKDKYENLVHAGVVDPAKVVRSALENSASIASLLLTTEALVSEILERKARATSNASDIGGMY